MEVGFSTIRSTLVEEARLDEWGFFGRIGEN